MNIFLNGSEHEVKHVNLCAVLQELGYANRTIATAVNGCFVPHARRDATQLKEGDRLEIVAPMQGG